ncbi:MerR family transcriptional regulator [Paraclostridium bifermentans]|uniref:MerR family transcriptional regulator n=1 Tax=Paraclostridium bifermentans TaxID=1490 RepID=UPI00359CABD2
MYKISEVAKLSGISVRMLHHYDNIGLLVPSEKSDKNYRLYSDEDVKRLYQILIFKELEFSLKEIKNILDDENFDREKALRLQRELIVEKRKRMDNILNSIDEVIDNLEGDKAMSNKDFKAFSYEEIKKHEEKYKEETEKRYGKSNAYKECNDKTGKYSKNDWENISKEADSIYKKLAGLMDRQLEDTEVQDLVDQWRNHISKNYYNCTIDIFRGLALMYVADERFTKNIDKYKDGLAQFLSDAMNVYCDNHSK